MEGNVDQQSNARLTRLLIIALLIAVVIFIFRQAWEVVYRFSQVIVLFGVSWLIAFLVSPVINFLSRHPAPYWLTRLLRRRGNTKWATALDTFRVPHTLAVILVYLVILFVLALVLIYAVPALGYQLVALAQATPRLIQRIPALVNSLEAEILARGFEVDLARVLNAGQLLQAAQDVSSRLVQIAVSLATGVASAVANILLILTISLYMNLDSPRLSRQLHAIVPDHYMGRVNLVGQSLGRTFGGFMRGQLLIGVAYGVPAAIVMAAAGIGLAAVFGVLSGVLMLVPLIGAPIAMVLPAIGALIQSPDDALWLFIAMTAYQQVLTQVLAPKLMATAIGMPSLLVVLSMLVTMRIMGLWGLVFGIPLAGVIYALSVTYLEQAKIRRESLPRGLVDLRDGGIFRLQAMGPGCLLLPDVDAEPGQLRAIAEYLAVRGITSLGIEPFRGQEHAYWEDWYAVVLPALDQLWRDCNQVFIVGEGVGALLALHAASELPISGVCAIAVPLSAGGRHEPRPNLIEEVSGAGETALALQPQVLMTTRARVAITHLQERVHSELPQVLAPVMIVHPDAGSDPEDARYVLERLGTVHKRIEWLDARADRAAGLSERLAQVCFTFIRNYLQ